MKKIKIDNEHFCYIDTLDKVIKIVSNDKCSQFSYDVNSGPFTIQETYLNNLETLLRKARYAYYEKNSDMLEYIDKIKQELKFFEMTQKLYPDFC